LEKKERIEASLKPKLKVTTQTKTENFGAVRLNRLKGFTDGYEVKLKALRCPRCNTLLLLGRIIVSSWPYVHADWELYCVDCDALFLFGLPEDPVVGMELIIWDSQPERVLAQARKIPKPLCPFHHVPMELTKIFGDKIRKDNTLRIQHKCPEWFLTHHQDVQRE
jgi:hypothetical protein